MQEDWKEGIAVKGNKENDDAGEVDEEETNDKKMTLNGKQ